MSKPAIREISNIDYTLFKMFVAHSLKLLVRLFKYFKEIINHLKTSNHATLDSNFFNHSYHSCSIWFWRYSCGCSRYCKNPVLHFYRSLPYLFDWGDIALKVVPLDTDCIAAARSQSGSGFIVVPVAKIECLDTCHNNWRK